MVAHLVIKGVEEEFDEDDDVNDNIEGESK